MAVHTGSLQATLQAGRRVSPVSIALSLGLTVLSMLISGLVWTRVLHCMGCRATLKVGLAVYAGTGLAAYIGLGAGAAAECVVLLRPHGVGARRAVLLLVLASLVGFCGSMVWAPCGVLLLEAPAAAHALPALGTHGPLLVLIATGVCGVGALFVLVLLALASRCGVGARLVRAVIDTSGRSAHLPLFRLLALIPYAALAWGMGAGSLWLMVRASGSAAGLSLPMAIGIQTVATVAGSVTFFLPNGLGARDGALVGLLVSLAGVPLPAAVAAVALLRASDPVAKVLIVLALTLHGRLPLPRQRQVLRQTGQGRGRRVIRRRASRTMSWFDRADRPPVHP
jgi:hypothetical protein